MGFFGVWGLGFGVWGLGFGVWGLEFGVWGLGFLGLDCRFGFSGKMGSRFRLGARLSNIFAGSEDHSYKLADPGVPSVNSA